MLQNIRKQQKGFTIIEVLIVLAIAGLILLIVFLAVPALQRNSRNTQRASDASKVAAAVSQCMGNRNGTVASCSSVAQLQSAGGLDNNALQQLTTVQPGGAPGNTTTATFQFNLQCNADGSGTTGGSSTRQAVVQFRNEGTGNPLRCIDV